MSSVIIDLLADEPCVFPPCTGGSPLDHALGSLRDKFEEILTSEGWGMSDITAASLLFQFPNDCDDHFTICTSRITSSHGRCIEYTVSASGETL